MTLRVLATIPILRIFDVAKAKEFYLDFLGFKVDWEHRFDERAPLYMQISLDQLVLHLSEHHGDCCPGSTVFVTVNSLDAYHAQIRARNYGYLRPGIEETFHRSRCMELIDPFGNRLRFDQPMPAPEQQAKTQIPAAHARCAPLTKNPTAPKEKSKTISTQIPRQFPLL